MVLSQTFLLQENTQSLFLKIMGKDLSVQPYRELALWPVFPIPYRVQLQDTPTTQSFAHVWRPCDPLDPLCGKPSP